MRSPGRRSTSCSAIVVASGGERVDPSTGEPLRRMEIGSNTTPLRRCARGSVTCTGGRGGRETTWLTGAPVSFSIRCGSPA